jgi:hypothetical protein
LARPSLLTHALRDTVERQLAEGIPVVVVAQDAGVARSTLHSWLADGRVVRREQPDPLLVETTAPHAAPDLDERLRAAVPSLVSVVLQAARRGSRQAAFRLLEAVDQRKLSVTADTYTHVMADSREADYEELVAV